MAAGSVAGPSKVLSIDIEEIRPETANRAWDVRNSLDNRRTVVKDTYDSVQEKLLQWYLEDYPLRDPLEKTKVSSVETSLELYTANLIEQIGLQPSHSVYEKIFINIKETKYPSVKSTINCLHWETSEALAETFGKSTSVVVTRIIRQPEHSRRAREGFSRLARTPTFRILLVVARHNLAERDHRVVSSTLLNAAQTLGKGVLEIEIVRPGTYASLVDHLRDAKACGRHFHLVHFDVHGYIQEVNDEQGTPIGFRTGLFFYPPAQGESGKVRASTVAKLLVKHQIPYAVLNACESGKSDKGLEANLARTFVQEGVPAVLAMSYKLLSSAINVFVRGFYTSFLLCGKDFHEAAADGRGAMRKERARYGDLGLQIDLQDWIIPVAYVAENFDLSAIQEFQFSAGKSVPSAIDMPSEDALRPDWDSEVLQLETKLLDPWQCSSGPVVNMYGFSGIGKTSLLGHCRDWWSKTSLFNRIYYLSFKRTGFLTPQAVCSRIAYRLQESDAQDQSTMDLEVFQENPAFSDFDALSIIDQWVDRYGEWRKLLVILDDFKTYESDENYSEIPIAVLTAWRNLFNTLAESKVFVIVASCSKLHWIEDGSFSNNTLRIEGHSLFGSEEATSLFYAIPGIASGFTLTTQKDNAFWSSVSEPEDLFDMKDICQFLANLPPLLQHYLQEPKALGIKSLRRSLIHGLPTTDRDEDHEEFLMTLSSYQLIRRYYDNQDFISRALLLSLASFSRHLGRRMDLYWPGFVKCLTTDLQRCLPKRYHPSTITTSIFKLFGRKHPKHWLQHLAQQRPVDLDLVEKGHSMIEDLNRVGLLRPVFFYFEEGDQDDSGRITLAYQIHPCLTLFLRRRFMEEIPYPTASRSKYTWTLAAKARATFIDYHASRLDSWKNPTDRELWLDEINQETESELGQSNLLTALEFWLERDFDHRNYEYPKKLVDWYFARWPLLCRHQIEPTTLASYVGRLRKEMLNIYDWLLKQSLPNSSKVSRIKRSLLPSRTYNRRMILNMLHAQYQKQSPQDALELYLRIANWLVYYNVLAGEPKVAEDEIDRSGKLIDGSHNIYSLAFGRLHPNLEREKQVTATWTKIVSARDAKISTLDNTETELEQLITSWLEPLSHELDPIVRRWNDICFAQIGKSWRYKRRADTWGFRTREELQLSRQEHDGQLREVYTKLWEIFPEWFERARNNLQEGIIAFLNQFGDGHEEVEWEDIKESAKEMIGIYVHTLPPELIQIGRNLRRAVNELRAGRRPHDVLDKIFSELQDIWNDTWRMSSRWGLELGLSRNDIILSGAYHHFLVKNYIDRKDWLGLDHHLNQIELDRHRGGQFQWLFAKGLSNLHLENWDEAGRYLTGSLELTLDAGQVILSNFTLFGTLTGIFGTRFQILYYLTAFKYGAPESCATCPLPTWRIFLESLAMGYASTRRIIYAQGGAILEQLTQHYFAPATAPRSPLRVLELPEERDFGSAIIQYNQLEEPEAGQVMISDQSKDAFLLVEFLQSIRDTGLLTCKDPQLILNAADSFFDPREVASWRLKTTSSSFGFFKSLKTNLQDRPFQKLEIFENFEQYLFGSDVTEILLSPEENLA